MNDRPHITRKGVNHIHIQAQTCQLSSNITQVEKDTLILECLIYENTKYLMGRQTLDGKRHYRSLKS